MNHLQLFKYVQENSDLFDYELRSMMRTINNSLDLEKMHKDLILLLKFIDLKREDEKKYCNVLFNPAQEILRLSNEN